MVFFLDNSATCVDYANAGDCRFYKCFQEKFPCEVFGTSHVTDFEFPLCEDLKAQNLYLDLQVTLDRTNTDIVL